MKQKLLRPHSVVKERTVSGSGLSGWGEMWGEESVYGVIACCLLHLPLGVE